MNTMKNATLDAKTRILEIAAPIFYKHGYRATGVDAIAKAVGVTKATLYHYFENKDKLIEETLRHFSEYGQSECLKLWSKKSLKPEQKLTVLFDSIEEHFRSPNCYGCPFINAAAEYTDRHHPVRRICEQHYEFMLSHLEQFARDAGLNKPRLLAEEIVTLINGAYTAWFTSGIADAAKQGKRMAESIIAQHKK